MTNVLVTTLKEVGKEREALNARVKGVLSQGLKDFMAEHSNEITAIGWTQFTPYFNDGDTCEFSVGAINVSNTATQPDSFYDDEDQTSRWHEAYGKTPPKDSGFSVDLWQEICEFATALNATDLKSAFGDHVQVIVTKDGVEVSDYEHE